MRICINKKTAFIMAIVLFISFTSTVYSSSQKEEQQEKIIYLTFDDGPDKKVTDSILDILNEENVKGTFFVVGQQFKGNETTLKRIHSEGHTLGLHSYTHDFNKLYRGNKVNNTFFMSEMLRCQKELKEITGVNATVLRFPGGSYKRLNNDLISEFSKNGFKVFDWTHSAEDGVDVNAPSSVLFKNSLKKIPSSKKSPGVILLMHCNASNKNSAIALPRIIEHYKSKGYKFLPITNNTPEYPAG